MVSSRNKKKTAIYGFIDNERSALSIYSDHVERANPPSRYLLTYKPCQDHLELYLAAIRARDGHNNDPDARQFRGAHKRLLVRHQVKTCTANFASGQHCHSQLYTCSCKCCLQSVEVEVPEDDMLPNFPDACSPSEYTELHHRILW